VCRDSNDCVDILEILSLNLIFFDSYLCVKGINELCPDIYNTCNRFNVYIQSSIIIVHSRSSLHSPLQSEQEHPERSSLCRMTLPSSEKSSSPRVRRKGMVSGEIGESSSGGVLSGCNTHHLTHPSPLSLSLSPSDGNNNPRSLVPPRPTTTHATAILALHGEHAQFRGITVTDESVDHFGAQSTDHHHPNVGTALEGGERDVSARTDDGHVGTPPRELGGVLVTGPGISFVNAIVRDVGGVGVEMTESTLGRVVWCE